MPNKINKPVDELKQTSRIVIVPTEKVNFPYSSQNFNLNCNCVISSGGRSTYRDLLEILNELQATQNWRNDYEFSWASRMAIFLKLTIKRPSMLLNLVMRATVLEIQSDPDCFKHEFVYRQSKFWYSITSARIGFPWSDDAFINSLNAIRDLNIDFLIFSPNSFSGRKVILNMVESECAVQDKISKQIYKVLACSPEIKPLVLNELWRATKLCSISEATIHNGSVVSKSTDYISLDHTWSPKFRPLRMAPCSIWNPHRNNSAMESVLIPGNFETLYEFSEGFFVDASANYYHFLSESLRPLVMSLETGYYPKRILIKDGLPFQFYEILKSICPNSQITVLENGSTALVQNLSFGVITEKLSKTNEVFSHYSVEELRLGDEFRTWSFLREHFNLKYSNLRQVYLPRRKQESRGLLNDSGVEKLLNLHGYQTLHASEENFNSQLETFSQTKIFCSTSGAGLLNMIFMPEASRVIEIVFPAGHSWKFLSDLFNIKLNRVEVSRRLPKKLEYAIDTYYLPLSRIQKEITIDF